MEFNQITIPCARRVDEWFTLIGLGDIHEGNAGCDLDALQKVVDKIKQNDSYYWVGMGDYVEAINFTDKRFDIRQVAKKYRNESIERICQEQIETMSEIFYPIRKKCVGLLRGNHEETVRQSYHYDVLYDMWKHLNDIKVGIRGKSKTATENLDAYPNPVVKLLYDAAVVRLSFISKKEKKSTWKNSFDIFVTHSNIAGRSAGGKVNRLEKLLADWHTCDVVMVGHGHDMPVDPTAALSFNRYGKFISRKRRGVMTGTFLKVYTLGGTGYAEKAGYSPSEIGTPSIQFNPVSEDLRVIV
jgi:predicted phosphodiesterase